VRLQHELSSSQLVTCCGKSRYFFFRCNSSLSFPCFITRFGSRDNTRSEYMPAMHKCLETPDLLEMICKALKDDFGNHDKFALSSLARTCRAFHEPALDILWHTLSSIVPLLKTFPPCLWNVAQVANGKTLFVRSTLSGCPNLPLRHDCFSIFIGKLICKTCQDCFLMLRGSKHFAYGPNEKSPLMYSEH
jgi:hypothetical protein